MKKNLVANCRRKTTEKKNIRAKESKDNTYDDER